MQIANLVELLDRKYVSTGPGEFVPCDFGVVAQYFALDAISSLLWSEPIGFMGEDADVGNYIQTLEEFLPVRQAISSLPMLPWLEPFIGLLLPSTEDKFGLGRLQGIAKEATLKRVRDAESGMNKGNLKRDMITAFMEKGLKGNNLLNEVYMSM